MKKGKDRVYSEGFDFPLWLKILIVSVAIFAVTWFDVWLVYNISESDLPLWIKFFLLS